MFGEYVNWSSSRGSCPPLSGWRAPFEALFIPGPIWLLLKIAVLVFIYMWVRWTIFRYRYNQLMSMGWKVLLPVSIANLAVTAIIIAVVG
jgi:NADH-quinone oxidoreductase subunit H